MEDLMTGLIKDEDVFEEYEMLETSIRHELRDIKLATGRKSKV